MLTNAEFVRVIDVMTLAAKGDNPLRFGEVAVGQGVLTSDQVERGLADQVRGIINRALAREASQWTFDASPSAAKPPRSFSIDIDQNPLGGDAAAPRDLQGRPGRSGRNRRARGSRARRLDARGAAGR